ncbi:MAG: hypothetical protein AAB116_10970 [Candidatus Poribacteria bacterium]
MRKYIIALSCLIALIVSNNVLSIPFEEKNPRDEKLVLVPRGAQPVLREEYPRSQMVVDRIKARHRYSLNIPFARAWNTAALTFSTGVEQEPNIWNNREVGFAIHNQRLRIGALKNKEYFQRETAGFPEGRYMPLPSLESVFRSTGYLSSTFIHIKFKQIRNEYSEPFNDGYMGFFESIDKLGGLINIMLGQQNQSLNLMAQRDSQELIIDDNTDQSRIRNTASIIYKRPGEGSNKLELQGSSVWSSLIDHAQKRYRYASGIGYLNLVRRVAAGFDVDFKAKLGISNLVDQTDRSDSQTLETRKSILLDVSNIANLTSFLKFRLSPAGTYDSKYKWYIIPDAEFSIVPKYVQLSAGYHRKVVFPNFDDLYWQPKSFIVNNSLNAVDYWEAYGSFNIDVLTRLKLSAKGYYSRPESRLTWIQLSNHVWQPINVNTSEAITGEASVELNLIRSFNIFANYKYQRFDNQLFDPENMANGGIYMGRPLSGTITIGGCFWNYQPKQLDGSAPTTQFNDLKIDTTPENLMFAYIRISKSFYRLVNIFIDGRYTINREDVIFYDGIPQSGRIISVGANIVFGGLD